jgi:hypothetical protein
MKLVKSYVSRVYYLAKENRRLTCSVHYLWSSSPPPSLSLRLFFKHLTKETQTMTRQQPSSDRLPYTIKHPTLDHTILQTRSILPLVIVPPSTPVNSCNTCTSSAHKPLSTWIKASAIAAMQTTTRMPAAPIRRPLPYSHLNRRRRRRGCTWRSISHPSSPPHAQPCQVRSSNHY